MSYSFNNGRFSALTNSGQPASGYLLYTYVSGTTTPQATYTDSTLGTPNTNPVQLNARGEAPIWLAAQSYSFTLKDQSGATVWTIDGVQPPDLTVSASLTAFTTALSAVSGSSSVGFSPTSSYAASTLGAHLAGNAYDPRDYPWLAKFDGATDDTAAINACAAAARGGPRAMRLPSTGHSAVVSASLDFSGLFVTAEAPVGGVPHIQASSAQFDVITTTGNTVIRGMYVHGGWNGTTTGLSGDTISIKATSPAYPYNVHLRDCVIQYSKRRGIYWERGGYSSAYSVKCNASGMHGLELFGNSGGDACTTIAVGGMSVFSDTPNGYGVKITECINLSFDSVICENTQGISFNGNDNRAISIKSLYQEGTIGGVFATFGTSGGVGLTIGNCFGGSAVVQYPTNWQDVHYEPNALLGESAVPLANRILLADGGQQLTTVAGSFTAASISLPPGTWQVYGIVQTLNSASGMLTSLGATITTNASDSGLNNSTSTPLFGADEMHYNPGASADARVQPFDIVQNTSTSAITIYLRTYVGWTAGTVAFRGLIKAVKFS